MKETFSDDEIAHPLNEALLQEASSLKEERGLLKERLEKLDQSQSGVSASVYEKVRNDYLAKIKANLDRLISIKKTLESEQKALVEKKASIEVGIKQHREKIEEAELRHSLGEHTTEQMEEVRASESREITRLENALQNLSNGIERHRTLFEGVAKSEPVERPRETPPPPEKTLKEESLPQETTKIRMEPASTEKVSAPPLEPVKAKTAELLVLENGKVTQMVPLNKTICIGRSPANDVVLKEPKVSRKHAEIHCTAGKYILLDLESSNGTFIGGKKITEQILQPNDEIVIGNTKMVFKT